MNKSTRNLIFAIALLALWPLLVWAVDPIIQTRPLKIDNTRDEVKLTIQGPLTHTSNSVEIFHGSNLKFAIPSSGHLATTYGGTGTNTTAGAFNTLSPLTTRGDLLTRDATTHSRLAIGAANRVLRSDGTDPAWGQVTLTTDVTGILPIANGGTATNTAAGAKTKFGIQSGTATTAADGTVTNTFATDFASAPVVVTTPVNNVTPTNTVVSVTTSNFVHKAGVASLTINWVAIGAP